MFGTSNLLTVCMCVCVGCMHENVNYGPWECERRCIIYTIHFQKMFRILNDTLERIAAVCVGPFLMLTPRRSAHHEKRDTQNTDDFFFVLLVRHKHLPQKVEIK